MPCKNHCTARKDIWSKIALMPRTKFHLFICDIYTCVTEGEDGEACIEAAAAEYTDNHFVTP